MKKLLFVLCVGFLVAFPVHAQNKLKDVHFVLSNDVQSVCGSGAEACTIYAQKTIYLNSQMPITTFKYALLHEICHWIIKDKYAPEWSSDEESACVVFSLWFWHRDIFGNMDDYFVPVWQSAF